jgi:Protein of unknown function (DUF3826)
MNTKLLDINLWRREQLLFASPAKKTVLRLLSFSVFSFLFFLPAVAQTQEEVYRQRSEKIVNTLGLTRKAKQEKLVKIIATQYNRLNQLHDNAKQEAAVLKQNGASGEDLAITVNRIEQQKKAALKKLHRQFTAKLYRKLTDSQAGKVKDGMTYNVMNVTYTAYQEMILTLTPEQKQTIYNWLKEAREAAMDEGSSDDKHKVFGKYKGKINNYLSAEGYDMKAEEKAWQQRLREKREKPTAEKTPQQTR